ncbi:MAG: hypothetical protein BWX83_01200 [Candidatus Cloacimonetes bacterium ADurb.Bin117]|nr:MAG: hypothetical protein BWX83_01200 [Candidatus Cloacimonetes bacterium ADurb.Bin117]
MTWSACAGWTAFWNGTAWLSRKVWKPSPTATGLASSATAPRSFWIPSPPSLPSTLTSKAQKTLRMPGWCAASTCSTRINSHLRLMAKTAFSSKSTATATWRCRIPETLACSTFQPPTPIWKHFTIPIQRSCRSGFPKPTWLRLDRPGWRSCPSLVTLI